jgi:hypothetical protein
MQLINKIDELIKFANHRIDYLKANPRISTIDGYWNEGYDKGYIAAMHKYLDDMCNLKNIIIEINKDDDDV